MFSPPPIDFWMIAGMVILLLGRQVFWIFICGLWAIAGAELGAVAFAEQPGWLQVGAILIGAMTGALLALFIQPFAAAIAGFFAGGSVCYAIAQHYHYVPGPSYAWVPFMMGGILGALLMLIFFDWALIALSAGYGAMIVVQQLHPRPDFTPNITVPSSADAPLFLGLAVLGMLFQALIYKRGLVVK